MNNNEIDKKIDNLMDLLIDNDLQESDKDRIENDLNEILKIEPDNTRALNLYAMYYENFKDYSKAIECYKKILQYATNQNDIEDAESYMKDCKKLIELQKEEEEENKKSQYSIDCETPESDYKLLENLPPIILFIVKIIILVIFLLLNKFIF